MDLPVTLVLSTNIVDLLIRMATRADRSRVSVCNKVSPSLSAKLDNTAYA